MACFHKSLLPMILYSVTVSVEKEIAEEWLEWMQTVHIPDVMNTGYFDGHNLQRILDPVVDESLVTYNIQYQCPSMEHYEAYQQNVAPALQQAHTDRYQNRFVAFRTLLERI